MIGLKRTESLKAEEGLPLLANFRHMARNSWHLMILSQKLLSMLTWTSDNNIASDCENDSTSDIDSDNSNSDNNGDDVKMAVPVRVRVNKSRTAI